VSDAGLFEIGVSQNVTGGRRAIHTSRPEAE